MNNKTKALLWCLLLCFTIGLKAQAPLQHPWQGAKVGFLGDSIWDPNAYTDVKKTWSFLSEWLGITPYVYAVSGNEWTHIRHQAEQLKVQHGDDVDAIIVFVGTNDFLAGVPIGEWWTEKREEVMQAVGHPKAPVNRVKRTMVMSDDTYKGRINQAVSLLKQLYPTKQIVLLTPLHRGLANFGDRNLQPDESYQNSAGEYIDAYIQASKEAADVWGIPVIDLSALSGLNPMIEEQVPYFINAETDRLHPNTSGHQRMAATLYYQLMTLPVHFDIGNIQTPVATTKFQDVQEHSPEVFLVMYDAQVGKEPLLKAIQEYGAEIKYDYKTINGMALRKPANKTLEETMQYFRSVKGVTTVEYDHVTRLITPVKPKPRIR